MYLDIAQECAEFLGFDPYDEKMIPKLYELAQQLAENYHAEISST